MVDRTYTDGETVIEADWLNYVNERVNDPSAGSYDVGTDGGEIPTNDDIESREYDFDQMPKFDGNLIVESDSNDDGHWTKWADGTIVMRREANFLLNDQNDDNEFYETGLDDYSVPFPQSVESTPAASFSLDPDENDFGAEEKSKMWISNDDSTWRLAGDYADRRGSVDTYLSAIGRWFEL